MVATKLLHARFINLGAIVWLLGSASISAETYGPNCIQVLSGSSRSKSCDAEPIRNGSPFYSVSCKSMNVPLDSYQCELYSNQPLRIALKRFAPISHVLLREPTLVGKNIRSITIWNGITYRECKYTESINTDFDELLNNKEQRFAKFSCGASNSRPAGFMAGAIEINSIVHRTLDLSSVQTTGLLDWVILMQHTATNHEKNTTMESLGERMQHHPHAIYSSPHDTVESGWNDTKRNNKTSPPSSEGDEQPLIHCPPINPYHGMPETYQNYQMVSDGSINELLLTKPCRPGFKLVGSVRDISQCKNGTWQGNGFPECDVTLTSTPPNVNHATWNYVHDDVFHEISYTCDDDFYLVPPGAGKAVYSVETDEWIGVPHCQQQQQQQQQQRAGTDDERYSSTQDHWLIIYCAVAACVIFVPLVVVIVVLRSKNRKLKQRPAAYYETPASYVAVSSHWCEDANYYVEPDNTRHYASSNSENKKNDMYEETIDDFRCL